jgi:predicted regulator of Ras-like GTPase activity (Roadblock/LC7/MglB family)
VTNAEHVRQSLVALRDVEGVTGSFVFVHTGRVVARELPPLFDDGALMEAGSRLARLRETFAAVGDDLSAAVIRFRDYKIYLRTVTGGTLCIVASNDVNMPAMRMAANLVGRRIGPALENPEGPSPVPPLAPEGTPTEPTHHAPRPAALAPPGMRRFRGRPVD